MYKIQTLNSISEVGLKKLPEKDFIISGEMENPDGIILRSFDMHKMELPESLLAVARAGAGTNNIPIDKCSERGIVVFNTPGANANAVKELVITGLLISSRQVIEGIEWTKSLKGKEGVDKLVEKGKAQFAGPEIMGKKLGVIGLGAIGVLVANAAVALGMEVYGYDPYLSIDGAWSLASNVIRAESVEAIMAECDYVSIHVPLNDSTRNMINKEMLALTKKGLRLLNFARDGLVDTEALKDALADGTVDKYITDFPGADVLELENVIAIPHLGASTPESEEKCAEMAALEIKGFLKYGVINNSVNFPNCQVTYTGKTRIAIMNKNVPNAIGLITKVLADKCINIDNMTNKSKGNWAYTLIDVDSLAGLEAQVIAELKALPDVVGVRVIKP